MINYFMLILKIMIFNIIFCHEKDCQKTPDYIDSLCKFDRDVVGRVALVQAVR
jgi:hypothetical protein